MRAHRIHTILLIIFFFSLFLTACADTDDTAYMGETGDRSSESSLPENDSKVTIAQGIWGNVWLWEGNHMPSTDKDYTSGTIAPVVRQIYVYELTSPDDAIASADGSFYSDILVPLITTTTSDSDGFYEADLPPGTYTLLVKENDLYYSPLYGENGELNPVTVEANQVVRHQIDITHQATF